MKSKIFLGLLLLSSAHNNVFAAQAVVAMQEKQVPSLEELCLKKITHILRTEDSDLKEKNYFSDALLPESMLLPYNIKESLKEWVILSNKITVTAAALWVQHYDYFSPDDYFSPFQLLEQHKPDLAHLVTQKRIPWTLSIQDLIDAGGSQILQNRNTQNWENKLQGNLNNLSLTSLKGLPLITDLSALTKLVLNNNKITTIGKDTFNRLTALQELNLSSNKITTIEPGTFNGLAALTRLYLHNNPIKKIKPGTFNGLTGLRQLYLNNNQITTIKRGAFNGLTALQELNLNNNQITTIEPGTFNGLATLTKLYLWNNQITTIEQGTFNGLTALTQLNLENNPIKTIEPGAFDGLPAKLKHQLLREFNVK